MRVGVIGLGLMGRRHARIYQELPGVGLVALAETDPSARAAAEREFGLPVQEDYLAVLADPDVEAVSICLPDRAHKEAVIAAIRHGKHVLVEKPLTTDPAEAEEIIAAYEAGRVKLMCGFLLRFDPRYATACELARRGDLGEIVHLSSRRNSSVSGPLRYGGQASLAYHVATHELDLILWCMGREPINVYTAGVAKVLAPYGIEDTLLTILRFPDGAAAALECSWILPATSPTALDAKLEIVGTEGVVTVDTANQGVSVCDARGTRFPDTMRWVDVQDRVFGALRDELAHFAGAVDAGTAPINDVYQGARVTRIARAMVESARTGSPVTLKR